MFRRRPRAVTGNEKIADFMGDFFADLDAEQRSDPGDVARAYGRHVWGRSEDSYPLFYQGDRGPLRPRYSVSLSVDDFDLAYLTKRCTLVSDTLILSHQASDPYFSLVNGRPDDLGMHCPGLGGVGQFILDAERLMRAGMTWYVPEFVKPGYRPRSALDDLLSKPVFVPTSDSARQREYRNRLLVDRPISERLIDYLVQGGTLIDASGARPIKSQLVRPILELELPFLDRVGLRDFSEITINEYGGYLETRHVLREKLWTMVDTPPDLRSALISNSIEREIEAVGTMMRQKQRTRALEVSGAVIGFVGATLVAVYGPALASVIAAVGATGGLWGLIHAMAENSPRRLRDDQWYYVWALSRKASHR